MHIPKADQGASGFVVKHKKSDSLLFNFDDSLVTAIELGQEEANSLSQAFGDSAIGVEEELESDRTESIAHPYKTRRRARSTPGHNHGPLRKRILEDEVDLAPPFQRKAGLWTQKQKSQLIESLLIRIPLPAFYFDATDDSRWLVVDGLQKFTPSRTSWNMIWFWKASRSYWWEYNGRRFAELPRPLRRLIEESQVTVHLIPTGHTARGEVQYLPTR